MNDDIVLEQAHLMRRFTLTFPQAITIEDTMRQMLALNDEIERLKAFIAQSDKAWDAYEQSVHDV